MVKLLTILILVSAHPFVGVFHQQQDDTEKPATQELNCAKFKNGTFRIPPDSTTPGSTLYRKGNIQRETMDNVDFYMECTVKWYGNCVYTLTPTKETLKKFSQLPENAMITVKIIEVRENSYVQTTSMNFADITITKEIFKIK